MCVSKEIFRHLYLESKPLIPSSSREEQGLVLWSPFPALCHIKWGLSGKNVDGKLMKSSGSHEWKVDICWQSSFRDRCVLVFCTLRRPCVHQSTRGRSTARPHSETWVIGACAVWTISGHEGRGNDGTVKPSTALKVSAQISLIGQRKCRGHL